MALLTLAKLPSHHNSEDQAFRDLASVILGETKLLAIVFKSGEKSQFQVANVCCILPVFVWGFNRLPKLILSFRFSEM